MMLRGNVINKMHRFTRNISSRNVYNFTFKEYSMLHGKHSEIELVGLWNTEFYGVLWYIKINVSHWKLWIPKMIL